LNSQSHLRGIETKQDAYRFEYHKISQSHLRGIETRIAEATAEATRITPNRTLEELKPLTIQIGGKKKPFSQSHLRGIETS